MNTRCIVGALLVAVSLAALGGCGRSASSALASREAQASSGGPGPAAPSAAGGSAKENRLVKTDAEWRRVLSPEQFHIMREKGTERAFTGKYWDTKTPGVYTCAACGQELFVSEAKFDSGCGWPSFFKPADASRVSESTDHSFGMDRTEVACGRCGAHLGHVFPDGPAPTGQRYCINSVSIELAPKEGAQASKPDDSAGAAKPPEEN